MPHSIQPKSNWRLAAAILIVAVIGAACGDDSSPGPIEGDVSLDPRIQWSGGAVEAASDVFVNAGEWVVLVDGEVVDSWRVGSDVIAFRLPNPKLTGTATVDIEVPGVDLSPSTVDVVGNAWPARSLACSAAGPCRLPRLQIDRHYYHAVRLPAGQLMAFFERVGGSPIGGGIGIATLDGPAPVVNWLPGLSASELPGLVAPGSAAEIRQWVFDVSSPEAAVQPMVWQVHQAPDSVRPLACLPDGIVGGYAVVELPTGDCLVLTDPGHNMPGSLTLNAVTPIAGYGEIPFGWTAGCSAFRSSAGNRWSTLRSLKGYDFCEWGTSPEGLPAWPVFDAGGGVSFSTTRYPEWVKGADFTPQGDTLWVVGATPTWSLDAWNPATGELLREVALGGFSRCEDVLVDPLRPYVYAACRRDGEHPNDPTVWSSLVVIDRGTGEIEAVLDPLTFGNPWPFVPPIEMAYGGSAGRAHLTGVWDGTTAPAERGVMVTSWDIH